MPPRECWIALQQVLYAKPLMAHALLHRFGSAEAVMRTPLDRIAANAAESAALTTLRDAVDWRAVDAILQRCAVRDLHLLTMDDPQYPPFLAACPDRPPVLFVDGQVAALTQQPTVAIVGSRKATRYGSAIAERLATELIRADVTVVSGLALGIDGVAHRAAVAMDGVSIGVLGSGLDRFYPEAHRRLAGQLRVRGAVVTEFPPDVKAFPSHFPQRNRVISGLSCAVVVVEAAEKSGSLITARMANEQGRAVFAVPGPVGDQQTRGTHGLLRQGAHLVESAEDILEVIRPMWEGQPPCVATARLQPATDDAMPPALLPWLAEARILDEIVAAAGRSPAAVLAWLTEMECLGRVRILPGNRYVKTGA